MAEVIRIEPEAADDRFSRFDLIGWWDRKRLADARIVLIGVGALGNEILKNLALLGVGRVFAADLDRIELSNLSRSVLFREGDIGRGKAEVAAERAREIYPAMRVEPFEGNVVYDLGLGVFRWADVILGGLDNREARVAINRSAARVGKIWIDGAIERLSGVARVFDPAVGPCYECTMGENDWKMLEARRSCALLSRGEMELGKTPTTPTTSSVIAGIQTQEAVKLLHGLELLSGGGFVFDGVHHQSYTVEYTRKDDCPAHEIFEPIEVLDWSIAATKTGDLLERVRGDLGSEAVIETNQDLLDSLDCPACGRSEPRRQSLGKINESAARCPDCGGDRIPKFFHTISVNDRDLFDATLGSLGVPAWEILTGRSGEERRFYEFRGDRTAVLRSLA